MKAHTIPKRRVAATVVTQAQSHNPNQLRRNALAQLTERYNAQPSSRIAREDLLSEARRALRKYELADEDRETAVATLTSAMHKLLEQRGITRLAPEQMVQLEDEVLCWCQQCKKRAEMASERIAAHPIPQSAGSHSRDIATDQPAEHLRNAAVH